MSSVNLLVPYKLKVISHLISWSHSQNQCCSFTVVVALVVVVMGEGGCYCNGGRGGGGGGGGGGDILNLLSQMDFFSINPFSALRSWPSSYLSLHDLVWISCLLWLCVYICVSIIPMCNKALTVNTCDWTWTWPVSETIFRKRLLKQ